MFFWSTKRFVLTFGEDAMVLTHLKGKTVLGAWVVSPEPSEGLAEVEAILKAHPDSAVEILVDDQSLVFREERLPALNILDQRKIVKRHLKMVFPGTLLKASLPAGRYQKDRFYLMMAMAITERQQAWFKALEKAPNRIKRVSFLPIENMMMSADIVPPLSKGSQVRWRISIYHHVTGGFRHIVSKQDRFIVTRLTQIEEDITATEYAETLQRDYSATIAYIKRHGYRPGDTIELLIITSSDYVPLFQDLDVEATHKVVISTQEVASRLKVKGIPGAESPYADILQAAWINGRQRRRVPMNFELALGHTINPLHYFYTYSPLITIALTVIGIGLNLFVYADWQGIAEKSNFERRSVQTLTTQLAAIRQKVTELPYDVADMRAVIALDNEFKSKEFDTIALLQKLGIVLGREALLHSLQMSAPDTQNTTVSARNAAPQTHYIIKVGVTFPAALQAPELALTYGDRILASLRKAMPDYTISMTRPPVDIDTSTALQGSTETFTAITETGESKAFTAEYTLEIK
jgi:hypothetical protein